MDSEEFLRKAIACVRKGKAPESAKPNGIPSESVRLDVPSITERVLGKYVNIDLLVLCLGSNSGRPQVCLNIYTHAFNISPTIRTTQSRTQVTNNMKMFKITRRLIPKLITQLRTVRASYYIPGPGSSSWRNIVTYFPSH